MKTPSRPIVLLTLVFAAVLLNFGLTQAAHAAIWATNGPMTTPRSSHTATLLPNGKVLVAGGITNGSARTATAEIYDPATGTWTVTGSMNEPRAGHTAVLLPNGKILVAGGTFLVWPNGSYGNSAELYDPATGEWAFTGGMNSGRAYHTAALLLDGRVLVAGGKVCKPCFSSHSSVELYDPVSGTWTNTTSMSFGHSGHTSTLLPDGRVLIVGGGSTATNIFSDFSYIVELYDPATEAWTITNSLNYGRSGHTATMLADGRVMVVGGTYLSSVELFDPVSGMWMSTNSLNAARTSHSATLLPSGRVLVVGGYDGANALASVELFDLATGTWTLETNALSPAAYSRTATLLPSGRLLIAGGFDTNSLSSTEVYDSANGSWTNTGSLTFARHLHTANLLPNGKVLVAGGGGNNAPYYLSNAELFDPTTGTWTNTGAMSAARLLHTATLLPNGKLLVVGGYNHTNYLTAAESFNPATGTWTNAGVLNNARYHHTATLLISGKVLITGGRNNNSFFSGAEIFDPPSGTWKTTGSMTTNRSGHTAVLLPNGKVLVTGGNYGSPTNFATHASAELFDPACGTWTTTGSMISPRAAHAALLLPNGKVLVAGGDDDYSTSPTTSAGYRLASAEIYDPSTGSWTNTGVMHYARDYFPITLLPNGKVFVARGDFSSGGELFDPAKGVWTALNPTSTNRWNRTATLLPDERVLITGGTDGLGHHYSSAELYDVGSGFSNSWRPQVTLFTSPLNLGNNMTITGAQLRGISGASGGNTQDSPSDYPLVQLRSIESGQTVFLQTTNWSTNSFTSLPVWNFPPGWAMVTVFVNGIPSTSSIVNIGVPVPTPPTISDAKQLTNGTFQFTFTNSVGAVFGALASTNVSLPLSNWTALGSVTEISPGQFQFTDAQTTNSPQRFYRVRAN